ncbi:hypothetical protein EST38_g1859 [Candolleomyces aberdarensis]|uniref:Phosphatidylinositol transfer protein SFH5 n=1 Tax=Candolleomyces aberdarensis TaxID=2316362 RepID=A0A4Q2DTY0_9AGAR|nr:hypothetical protein EST38_g1859 [Candolleomyces aberdarensis]
MSDPAAVQTTLASEQPALSPAPEVATPSKPAAEANEAPREVPAPEIKETSATDAAPQSDMLATKATPAEGEKKEPTVTSTPVTTAADDAKVPDEDKEPQNTLTERFTRAEWDVLKKFRAELPEIFAEAYTDKADGKTAPITFWGVPIDPQNPKADARVSVILMKFLRARNLNPTAAREMLVNTLRWRESFNVEAVMKEEFPEDIFGNMGKIYGLDKERRPVVYNLYGGNSDLKAVFSDVQRFIRWRVALQERSILLLDFNEVDQMIQIHDYAGVSMSSRDANSKAAASEASNIFSSHYPETLYRKFFVNVPTLLSWIFWAFKAIIPSATMAKMSMVGSGDNALRKALLPYVDSKELPKRYGGDAEAF